MKKIKVKPKIFVNKKFFKKWSPKMAYVLGYFAADGCMFVNPRGSRFFDFTSTDKELIEKVKRMMASKHTIGERTPNNPNRRVSYRLQVGSKEMFKDLLEFGFTPRKSKTIKLPNIHNKYFSDFVRGYFDGDGCVDCNFYNRKDHKSPQFILMTRFSCGNRKFLEDLFKNIKRYTEIKGGCIVNKIEHGYDLQFSIKDSLKLYKFMYFGISKEYFLERKYNIFQKAIKHYGGVA